MSASRARVFFWIFLTVSSHFAELSAIAELVECSAHAVELPVVR